jgi:hypothetical protein
MKVIIEKKHCVGSDYMDTTNCPLCKAIKEQHPESKLFHAGGDYVRDKSGKVRIYFNPDYGTGWNSMVIRQIINGEIENFVMELPYPEYDNRNNPPQPMPEPKEKIRYVSVPETLTEKSKELMTIKN